MRILQRLALKLSQNGEAHPLHDQPILYLLKGLFVSGFPWTDGSSPVQIKDINLSPHPVILRKGAKVTFGGEFNVESAVGMNYKIDVNLKKKGWWGTWLPIPCFGKW